MTSLENKKVLVIGLGKSGLAAAELLHRLGAKVLAVDSSDSAELQREVAALLTRGIAVQLGSVAAPMTPFDFVVVSPGVPWSNPLLAEMNRRKLPILGEFELGYQHSLCLNIAVTGTNGKTTTTELIERILKANRLKAMTAGANGTPISSIVEQTAGLDFLVLEASSFQLETIQYFRPGVAVLLNISPDHLDRYGNLTDYALAKARIFQNQQPFDWAIVQSEALAQLRAL